jgi:chorismate dehydratase
VPEWTNCLPDGTNGLPGPENTLPVWPDGVLEPAERLPDLENSLPGWANRLPDTPDTLPGLPDNLPGSSDIWREVTFCLPESNDRLPEVIYMLPGSGDSLPEPSDTLPEPSDRLPGNRDTVPEAIDWVSVFSLILRLCVFGIKSPRMSDDTPKLRMVPPELAEEIAHRLKHEQRALNRERESGLEDSLAPFRVGSVEYLNAVPLTRGIEDQIVFTTPARLAELLRRDELDAALVSITEVLLNDRYDILDGMAIASLGEVFSVLLAHKKPLEEAREIFCDTASLTSVNLLKVLLAERGLKPEFKPLENYKAAAEKDFVLLIGDRAIDFQRAPHQHEIFDLGVAWFEMTNLPFVYAVWALRRGMENSRLRRLLRETKHFGMETLEVIIRNHPAYDLDFRKDYLGWHVHFHLGSDEKRGIAKFCELLHKHGHGPVFEPKFVS